MQINKKIKRVLALALAFSALSSMTTFAGSFINPDTTNSTFNRWNAKVYAEKWAAWPRNTGSSTIDNPNHYINYASSGGDCTNFASQVLYAGGMIMLGKYTTGSTSSWYWESDSTRSYSWTGVTYFMQHWANYNGSGYQRCYSFNSYSISDALTDSTYYAIFKDLYEGDVIQYVGTDKLGNAVQHSQVVHKYDITDLYMAQHDITSDRLLSNLKLKDYLTWLKNDDGPNITVYTERMKKAVT